MAFSAALASILWVAFWLYAFKVQRDEARQVLRDQSSEQVEAVTELAILATRGTELANVLGARRRPDNPQRQLEGVDREIAISAWESKVIKKLATLTETGSSEFLSGPSLSPAPLFYLLKKTRVLGASSATTESTSDYVHRRVACLHGILRRLEDR